MSKAEAGFYMVPERLAESNLVAGEKLLLAIIARRIGKNDHAWPSQDKLAAWAGMTGEGVRLCADRLAKKGLLSIERRGRGRVKHYRLTDQGSLLLFGTDRPSELVTCDQGSWDEAAKSVGPKKDKKASKKRRKGRGKTFADLIPEHPALDSPEFRTAWAEWETFQREIKKSLTRSTAVKQLADLAKTPADAAARIEQSIRNGWRGLFEFKAKPSTQTPVDPSENWARALHGVNPDV